MLLEFLFYAFAATAAAFVGIFITAGLIALVGALAETLKSSGE